MPADRRTVLALTGALLAGAAGCTSSDDTDTDADPDESDPVTNDGPLEGNDAPEFPQLDLGTDPDLEPDLLARQIRGNVAFSFDLLTQLRDDAPDENLFYSPYSVSVALAMTYAGARGETAAEMADALRYELEDGNGDGDNDLHAAFGALEGEFERRNADGEEVDAPEWDDEERDDELGYQLSSANAVWMDEENATSDDYLELLAAYYEAGENLVDFAGSPEEAREEINAWVEEETNDRIEDLLPEGSIDGSTRLVLTNAVYFLAAWEHDFDPAATEPATFTSLDGNETDVEMMHQTAELRYAEIGSHQVVELPYANEDTSMIVVLPAEGEFESFQASLSVDRLATMLEELSRPQVDLALPKFGIESKFSLVEIMQELGMERAFGPGADFSGMVDGNGSGLFVDDIIHQSFVEVDEEGTEAAAATAVVMDESAPPEQVEMTVDRPFLFYIRDRPTETPLFVGRVVDGETLQLE
ncbi:serpin family protein [Natronorubrum sp. JWXQ-INN-674]|uniref:Serpin family protein n=1 Tax=Natronorubrum halalkaliphilum TaxID=2691917 RepID=A0A6B0VN58_9EURY|nr:serpin family protein [Natronorubrum halalkaliphilum]MXV63211.1 serpin family protein [Natronorubrum halalkaliphilum]